MNQADNANPASQPALAQWLTFPGLAEAWAHSPQKAIAHIAERATYYKAQSESAAPADRVRARLVALCYARVHSVLQELYAAEQASTLSTKEAK